MLSNLFRRPVRAVMLIGCAALLFVVPSAHAQRPSLGNLQQQINRLVSGEDDFEEVSFGENCRLRVDGTVTGLIEEDPTGLRLMGNLLDGGDSGCTLLFGPTDQCLIQVDPLGPTGLLLRDPNWIRLLPPPIVGIPLPPPTLCFGATDDCTIGIDPDGMVFRDPGRFCFKNPRGIPQIELIQGLLAFGDDCDIGFDPNAGIVFRDPRGFCFKNPLGIPGVEIPGGFVKFGDECTIGIDPEIGALLLRDPMILVESPLGDGEAIFDVNGSIIGTEFVQRSSRDLKENIRTIDDPLAKVKKLRGVYFDWKAKDGEEAADIGFIADEVANVISEATVFDEQDETKAKGVKYANLVALTVESIKAQQSQIEQQQQLIEQLQREIAAMRNN